MSGRPPGTSGDVRGLRWWLRLTGLLTLLAGVACIIAEPTWLPTLIVGIGLIVYGISALSTKVGRAAASGSSVPRPDADRTERADRAT